MRRILGLLILLISFNILADTGQFTYTPPTEREDNTPLPLNEIFTFKVYDNGVERTDFLTYPLQNNSVGFELDLTIGIHAITMTTVDMESRESIHSETLTMRIHSNPKPPSGLTVNIIPR